MAQTFTGLWRDDPNSIYITNLQHPVLAAEYRQRVLAAGGRYNEPMTPRQRRQFDRDMVQKYMKLCPLPLKAEFLLMTYDFMDAQEELAAREAKPVPVSVAVEYVDEDLF